MKTHRIKRALSGGVLPESGFNESHFDFEDESGETVRLVFPWLFTPKFGSALQLVTAKTIEQREAHGLPALFPSIIKKVTGQRFGRDELHQVVSIKTEFEDGTYQQTVLDRGQASALAEYIAAALRDFQSRSGQTGH